MTRNISPSFRLAEKRAIRARCIVECVMTEQAAFEAQWSLAFYERRRNTARVGKSTAKKRGIRRRNRRNLRVLRFFVADLHSFPSAAARYAGSRTDLLRLCNGAYI